MHYQYIIAPFFAYLVAGSLKFIINFAKNKTLAFKQIGLGGCPSTHTSIVTAVALLIGLEDGFQTSQFSIALTLALIVIIDASDLRRKVGKQAAILKKSFPNNKEANQLRERIGHSLLEILAGFLVGTMCALYLWMVSSPN